MNTGITTESTGLVLGGEGGRSLGKLIAPNYSSKTAFLKRNFHWLLFVPIFLAAAYLRFFGFFLPSNIGDPTASQSLAMKMNYGFMMHYDIYHYRMVAGKVPGTVDYVWEEDPKNWNSNRIRKIFHLPLHVQPPLYPVLIWLSHGVFNRGEPYTSVAENRGRSVLKDPPWNFFKAQFYAVIIPVACSLGTIILVYVFCLNYFSYREGLLAALLLTGSPVDIAVSSRPFADGVLVFFCTLALILYLKALQAKNRRPLLWATAAGLVLGFAYLTKFTGVVFAGSFLFATLVFPSEGQSFSRRFLDQRLWTAGLVFLLATLPWHLLVWKLYGSLLPPTPVDLSNPWHSFVFHRRWYAYPLAMLYFLPPLGVGWLWGAYCLYRAKSHPVESTLGFAAALFLLVLILLLKIQSAGLEYRYLLPAYPPLAILTGRAFTELARLLRKPEWIHTAFGVFFLLFVYGAWRSFPMGWNALFRATTLLRPFGW